MAFLYIYITGQIKNETDSKLEKRWWTLIVFNKYNLKSNKLKFWLVYSEIFLYSSWESPLKKFEIPN